MGRSTTPTERVAIEALNAIITQASDVLSSLRERAPCRACDEAAAINDHLVTARMALDTLCEREKGEAEFAFTQGKSSNYRFK
jgi:hypothetical protein